VSLLFDFATKNLQLVTIFYDLVVKWQLEDFEFSSLISVCRSWSCQASAKLSLLSQQEGGEDFTRSESYIVD